MTKLRDDLDGVVYIDGNAYKAGDEVPDGATVAESLLAPTHKPAPSKRGRPRRED